MSGGTGKEREPKRTQQQKQQEENKEADAS